MKHWKYIVLLTIFSCNNRTKQVNTSTDTSSSVTDARPQTESETCWTGTLNNKTPVFLHYKIDDSLIIGEITYLNTKDKFPILLVGTIEEDKSYRLLEFEKSGNITGVITGLPTAKAFNGSWFSPKTRKELVLNLIKKDTIVNSRPIQTNLQDIFGHYHYQYTDEGYQGDLDITRLTNSKIIFGITAVTEEPARNVAQVDDDTIDVNTTHFIYKIPESDNCEFEVRFYKGFAYIKYTKGYCSGQFGMNATIDGIFLKTE